jgi:hypothetical protein
MNGFAVHSSTLPAVVEAAGAARFAWAPGIACSARVADATHDRSALSFDLASHAKTSCTPGIAWTARASCSPHTTDDTDDRPTFPQHCTAYAEAARAPGSSWTSRFPSSSCTSVSPSLSVGRSGVVH